MPKKRRVPHQNNENNVPLVDSLILTLIQNSMFISNVQLQVVPPIIQEKQVAFKQLFDALHQRYYTETEISKIKKRGPSHEEKLNRVRLVATEAYNTWAAHLPTIHESYQDFCTAIEKRQAFQFNITKRKLAINRINLYIKLAAELSIPNNNNPSILVQFQQEWTTQLEDARKKGKGYFIVRFKTLLENLQNATDKAKVSSEQRAISCAELVKFLRTKITGFLQEVAEIDKMYNLIPHTSLIETETFTDFIFADLGANLTYAHYTTFINDLDKNNNTKDQLEPILKELKLKREMIYASIDINDSQAVKSKENYIKVVGSLSYLFYSLPEYTTQLDLNSVNYEDEELKLHKATVSKFIKQYLIYLETLQQQEKNTVLLDDQEKNIFAQEVDKLYIKIQNDVKTDLLTHHTNTQTTKAVTYLSLNM